MSDFSNHDLSGVRRPACSLVLLSLALMLAGVVLPPSGLGVVLFGAGAVCAVFYAVNALYVNNWTRRVEARNKPEGAAVKQMERKRV